MEINYGNPFAEFVPSKSIKNVLAVRTVLKTRYVQMSIPLSVLKEEEIYCSRTLLSGKLCEPFIAQIAQKKIKKEPREI